MNFAQYEGAVRELSSEYAKRVQEAAETHMAELRRIRAEFLGEPQAGENTDAKAVYGGGHY